MESIQEETSLQNRTEGETSVSQSGLVSKCVPFGKRDVFIKKLNEAKLLIDACI